MGSTVFFDLDGTLTDSKPGILRSIRHAIERLGLECPQDDDLIWCIGPPLLDSFSKLVGDSLAIQAVRHYRERFSEVGWRENEVYPGVTELLVQLAASGAEMYVATSKLQVFADRIVGHFQMDRYVAGVFGAEPDGSRSDKAELLAHALTALNCSGPAVMIGDRRHDVIGARHNGMQAVGVTYGYGTREELELAGADAIVSSPAALFDLLTDPGRS